jgi:spoIIIJ-associated protein
VSAQQLQVEATGETVGEAKWHALRELERLQPGLDKDQVRFQVISEGERGLLGVGYTPARVVAVIDADATPGPAATAPSASALAREAHEIIERVTRGIGIQCRIEVREDEETLEVSCSGRDLGMLIGRRGQTIDAIQYLTNAILMRAHPDTRKPVIVDAAGYRARRKVSLDTLAVRCAERAVATGKRVELEPMTAVERKLVHVRLKEYPGVETTSEGTEPNRFVVITPAAE